MIEPDQLFAERSGDVEREPASQGRPLWALAVSCAGFILPLLFGSSLVLIVRQLASFGGFTPAAFIGGLVAAVIAIVAGASFAGRVPENMRSQNFQGGVLFAAAIMSTLPGYATTKYLFLVASQYGYESSAAFWLMVIAVGVLSFHFVKIIVIATSQNSIGDQAREGLSLPKGVYLTLIMFVLGAWSTGAWLIPRFGPGPVASGVVIALVIMMLPLLKGWRRVHYFTGLSLVVGALAVHGTLERGLLATATLGANVELQEEKASGRLAVAHNGGWLTGGDADWFAEEASLRIRESMRQRGDHSVLLIGVPAMRIADTLAPMAAVSIVTDSLRTATVLQVATDSDRVAGDVVARDPMAYLISAKRRFDAAYVNLEGAMGEPSPHLRGAEFYRALAERLNPYATVIIAAPTSVASDDMAVIAQQTSLQQVFGDCSVTAKAITGAPAKLYICSNFIGSGHKSAGN